MNTAAALIKGLGLSPHPEGGYFLETYRAKEHIAADALPRRYAAKRNLSTAIYYLLEMGDYSALHRVQSDEIFHFYCGAPVEILTISPKGEAAVAVIGTDVAAGQHPQFLVPAGTVQALRPLPAPEAYALLGATVAPGFDFSDFSLIQAEQIFADFPSLQRSKVADLIRSLSPRTAPRS